MTDSPRLFFAASSAPDAQAALKALRAQYPEAAENEAEIIVALGGDGQSVAAAAELAHRLAAAAQVHLGAATRRLDHHHLGVAGGGLEAQTG